MDIEKLQREIAETESRLASLRAELSRAIDAGVTARAHSDAPGGWKCRDNKCVRCWPLWR